MGGAVIDSFGDELVHIGVSDALAQVITNDTKAGCKIRIGPDRCPTRPFVRTATVSSPAAL
jgi:hypothetical protein